MVLNGVFRLNQGRECVSLLSRFSLWWTPLREIFDV